MSFTTNRPLVYYNSSKQQFQAGRDDLANFVGGHVFYYKPFTCLLQLFETGGQAGQGHFEHLAGTYFFYYKPSTCILQLFETGGQAGQGDFEDLAGNHFF